MFDQAHKSKILHKAASLITSHCSKQKNQQCRGWSPVVWCFQMRRSFSTSLMAAGLKLPSTASQTLDRTVWHVAQLQISEGQVSCAENAMLCAVLCRTTLAAAQTKEEARAKKAAQYIILRRPDRGFCMHVAASPGRLISIRFVSLPSAHLNIASDCRSSCPGEDFGNQHVFGNQLCREQTRIFRCKQHESRVLNLRDVCLAGSQAGSNQGKRTVEVRIDMIPSHVTDLVFATCQNQHPHVKILRSWSGVSHKLYMPDHMKSLVEGRLAYELPGLVQVHRPPEHGYRCRIFRGFGEQLRGGADQSGT